MRDRQPIIGAKNRRSIPLWLIIGALVILAPIFIFTTLDNIHKQREHMIRVFLEKGEALIGSFEAGVRTEMAGGQGDFFRLQKLLIETAQQPDVDYLIVTDSRGTILADSDPSLIGETYGRDLDLDRISRLRHSEWRQVPNPGEAGTFEIFRRFAPADRHIPGLPDLPPVGDGRPRLQGEENAAGQPRQIVFIGLNMGPLEAARQEALRRTILIASLLLLIGLSGIVTLFLAQGYRAARISLSRIKAFSDNLVENIPIGLVALDSKGKILSFNQAAEAVLGRHTAEMVGTKGADTLPRELMAVAGRLSEGKTIIETELDCAGRDGKTTPLEVIATVLKEDDGALLGHVVLFRDLTEVERLKKEVVRSRQLASLGSLAAGIAHEIRNPLSSIKGFATYFKERYQDNTEDGKVADIMVQEVERLNRVIGQLLDFARPVAMDRKATPLAAVIQHTVKMIENDARARNVSLRLDLAPDVPHVVIDVDKMKQVLLNLYLNALEAMPQGGTLSVGLASNDARTVRLTVADTGPGIEAQNLARIFDPYFTTKQAGTGLGLTIVHKIIEAHDGEIRATSARGKGTTMSIMLPVEEKGGVPS